MKKGLPEMPFILPDANPFLVWLRMHGGKDARTTEKPLNLGFDGGSDLMQCRVA